MIGLPFAGWEMNGMNMTSQVWSARNESGRKRSTGGLKRGGCFAALLPWVSEFVLLLGKLEPDWGRGNNSCAYLAPFPFLSFFDLFDFS